MTKIHFKTYGCSVNISESEIMKGLLKQADFIITKHPDKADVIILNLCTVKGDNTAFRRIKKTREKYPKKKIIAAGCLTKRLIKKIFELDSEISLINTGNINSIVEITEETINDNPVSILAKNPNLIKLNLPKIRKNKVIGIVPILSGCNNTCAYCSVRLVKGRLITYPEENILNEVKQCLRDKCQEIWITSQDNAQYPNLPGLLKKITQIPGDFKIRVGMMNPKNILPILTNLIQIFKSEKIFKFLHIPVQSGDNEILKKMRRDYAIEGFKRIIQEFRQQIPEITIATDIITGFPTEIEEQFNNSLNLIKEIKPDVLNISMFSPRPGTLAANMENQIVSRIAKDRSRMLTSVFHNVARMQNERWLNWQGTALVDEKGKDNTMIARNFAYKPIIIKGNYNLGEKVSVKINKVTSFDLRV